MAGGSTLSDRGLSQQLAGAALDVFAETLRRDAKLAIFHGGAVRIAQRIDTLEREAAWDFIVGSRGRAATDEKLGANVIPFEFFAELHWPESYQTRPMALPGVADLVWSVEAAIQANPKLTWDSDWGPSPGGAVVFNEDHARHGIIEILPTDHGDFLPRNDQNQVIPGPCRMVETVRVLYGLVMEIC